MSAETTFLSELVKIHRHWVDYAAESLVDVSADLSAFDDVESIRRLQAAVRAAGCEAELKAYMEQVIAGVIHSILAGIDGAGPLKEASGVALVDRDGLQLKSYLHELWPRHYLP